MTNLLAICLAVAGSIALAFSAVLQHEGVGRAAAHSGDPGHNGRLTSRAIGRCTRDLTWLGGIALLGVGVTLHVVAVALAPISLVQPVGVLAVPLVVLLRARRARRVTTTDAEGHALNRYPAAWLAVAATACVVLLTSGATPGHADISGGPLALVAGLLGVLILVLATTGMRSRSSVRGLALAAGAGAAYGLGTALVRGLVVTYGDFGITRPLTLLAVAAAMLTCYVAGAWLVQQAYLASPPEGVMGTLTVVDPIVAVLVGLVALGEGSDLGPARLVGIAVAAAVGIAAVAKLSRQNPPSDIRPAAQPAPAPQPIYAPYPTVRAQRETCRS